jgi:hypothetical protein
MSRHVGRKHRWQRADARTYASETGKVVYERGAWYGLVEYRTVAPSGPEGTLPAWQAHSRRLGPFKRPRNAMMALEQEATVLKNRHGDGVRFGERAVP